MTQNLQVSPGIPIRIRKADPDQPIPSTFSTTPSGTIFSTTPGGTRIVYNRDALLNLRNSPLSHTPPKFNGDFPGICKVSPSQVNSLAPNNTVPLQNSFSSIGLVEPPSISVSSSHEEDENDNKHDSNEMFRMDAV